jgi:hypothetical protein
MTFSHIAVALGLLFAVTAIGPANAAGTPAKAQPMASSAPAAAPANPAGITKQHVAGGDDETLAEQQRAPGKAVK